MPTMKLLGAIACAILPINGLRILAYRLLGYEIRNSRIGFGTVIAVASARMEGATLGSFNLFIGPMSVTVGRGARVGNLNRFVCGFWTARGDGTARSYARTLVLGRNTLITASHYFDVAGSFVLGDGSWIAGIGSQFWTHGAGAIDRDIEIGEECYVGSAVRFAPGSKLGARVIVALGSVVTRPIEGSRLMIGGVPALVIKEGYDWVEADQGQGRTSAD